MTPAASMHEFDIPTGSQSQGIALGPDGGIWFTMESGAIGRSTPTGQIHELTNLAEPLGITAGPDGNVWFVNTLANAVEVLVLLSQGPAR